MPIIKKYFPTSDVADRGVLRWLARTTKINDLHSNHIIRVSADSIVPDTSLTAPIGYRENGKRSYLVSNDMGEHYYEIDMMSYEFEMNAVILNEGKTSFHPKHTLLVGNDNSTWREYEFPTLSEVPEVSTLTFKLKTAAKGRIFRFCVNGERFDGSKDLTLQTIDLFGTLRWFSDRSCQRKTDYNNMMFSVLSYFLNKT